MLGKAVFVALLSFGGSNERVRRGRTPCAASGFRLLQGWSPKEAIRRARYQGMGVAARAATSGG
jgi:hypothetical protein